MRPFLALRVFFSLCPAYLRLCLIPYVRWRGLRQQVVQFMSGVLHRLIEGLSLAACMERFKPHSSQCLFIREVWLDDVKRSSLNRLDPVWLQLFTSEARKPVPHDASILSGGSHCCFVELDELFGRCTRPLQHTQTSCSFERVQFCVCWI